MPLDLNAQDLSVYLGVEVDEARANMLINHAMLLCESIVSPVPDAAEPVVLSAAARAYSNPSFATQEMEGPYQVTRPSGGVYLSPAERAALRRFAGGGGAFSVRLIPEGYPESVFGDES